jgi:uncharacterized protein (UPF0332 family)/predicted nucleotidyltransferase
MIEASAARKDRALRIFLSQLLNDGVRASIAKVILFGSYAEGTADDTSDIDVLVLATDRLGQVTAACCDAQLEAAMATGESVEPIVRCVDQARFISSLFMYQVLTDGKEVYSMTGKEIRKKESQNYLGLAQEYQEAAEKNTALGINRAAVDLAYNACELSAKGLLLKKDPRLPSRHSGAIGRFGALYVQAGIATKELGRRLNLALTKRNQARYEPHSEISQADAAAIIALAKELLALLEQQLYEPCAHEAQPGSLRTPCGDLPGRRGGDHRAGKGFARAARSAVVGSPPPWEKYAPALQRKLRTP